MYNYCTPSKEIRIDRHGSKNVVHARRGRPGPRRTLTERTILDAAMALLSEYGADAVTIRGIATRVAVAPNAVYTYFPDKAAVLKELIEQLLGCVNHDRFTDSSQHWRDRVQALALELRAELLAHPGAVQLMLSNSLDGPNAKAVGETMLSVLADAGLDPENIADASHLLNVHIFGTVAFETTEAEHAELPAKTAPGTDIGTERFRWGLDRLLDGLAAHAVKGNH